MIGELMVLEKRDIFVNSSRGIGLRVLGHRPDAYSLDCVCPRHEASVLEKS